MFRGETSHGESHAEVPPGLLPFQTRDTATISFSQVRPAGVVSSSQRARRSISLCNLRGDFGLLDLSRFVPFLHLAPYSRWCWSIESSSACPPEGGVLLLFFFKRLEINEEEKNNLSFSSSLTPDLFTSDQLLTTHRSPSTVNRNPLQTSLVRPRVAHLATISDSRRYQ